MYSARIFMDSIVFQRPLAIEELKNTMYKYNGKDTQGKKREEGNTQGNQVDQVRKEDLP